MGFIRTLGTARGGLSSTGFFTGLEDNESLIFLAGGSSSAFGGFILILGVLLLDFSGFGVEAVALGDCEDADAPTLSFSLRAMVVSGSEGKVCSDLCDSEKVWIERVRQIETTGDIGKMS